MIGSNAWAPRPGTIEFILTLTVEQNTIRAAQRSATEPLYWLEETVAVGHSDVTDLVGRLKPGLRVAGHVEFDGDAPVPDPTRLGNMSVSLIPIDTERVGAASFASLDGLNFSTAPFPPGRYRFYIDHPNRQWRVNRVLLNGRDIYDEAIELSRQDLHGLVVEMTSSAAATLSGSVVFPPNADDRSAVVVAFPADYERWIGSGMFSRASAEITTAEAGTFVFHAIRPGKYLIAALSPAFQVDLQNPAFIRSIVPFARSIVTTPGANAVPALQLASGR